MGKHNTSKGISEKVVDGRAVFDVTDGTGLDRMTGRFSDLNLAIAYKAHLESGRKGARPRLPRDEWLTWFQGIGTAEVPCLTPMQPTVRKDATVKQLFKRYGGKLRGRRKGDVVDAKFQRSTLVRFFIEHDVYGRGVREVDPELADALPEWLNEERYTRDTAAQVIGYADLLWDTLERYSYVDKNPFRGVTALSSKQNSPIDRRGNKRYKGKGRAWTPSELVAIAMLIPGIYVLAFWLCTLAGLRRSEVLGLRNDDVDEVNRELKISRQRRGSAGQGTKDPKTLSGTRRVPLAAQLLSAVVRYRDEVHGPRPEDREAEEEWGRRYLIVGAKGGAMDGAALQRAVRNACNVLRLDHECLGFWFAPLHQLRKTFGSILQDAKAGLSGLAISIAMGHAVAITNGLDQASRTTREDYWLVVNSDLDEIGAYLTSWIESELGLVDLIADCRSEIPDPVSVERAAEMCGESDAWVLEQVVEGILSAEMPRRSTSNGYEVMRLDAREVVQLRNARLREQSETYSASDVVALLRLDRQTVYDKAVDGTLEEVTTNVAMRRAGGPGRTKPGGGRRFTKASVHAEMQRQAERLEKVSSWLTTGEAALLAGCSSDTIRRRASEGILTSWVDPFSQRGDHYICPVSLDLWMRQTARIAVVEVGRRLAMDSRYGRAAAKAGVLPVSNGTALERDVVELETVSKTALSLESAVVLVASLRAVAPEEATEILGRALDIGAVRTHNVGGIVRVWASDVASLALDPTLTCAGDVTCVDSAS